LDIITPDARWLLQFAGKPVQYTGSGSTQTLIAFVSGVSTEELVGAAGQSDLKAVIDAAAFAAAFPSRPKPQRFDRLATMGASYTVEQISGRPNMDDPVFFFLRLRGGSQ